LSKASISTYSLFVFQYRTSHNPTHTHQNSKAKFDETIEIAINLGVDPRKQNQNVRSSVLLPNGNGKKVRVAVFTDADNVQKALKAGADLAGSDEILDQVENMHEHKIHIQQH
jgi:large subunit ribosomal protein L1